MIKVSVNFHEQAAKPFPKLMISPRNDMIVFMSSEKSGRGTGVVLSTGESEFSEGSYEYNHWNLTQFIDFDGSITIKNGGNN